MWLKQLKPHRGLSSSNYTTSVVTTQLHETSRLSILGRREASWNCEGCMWDLDRVISSIIADYVRKSAETLWLVGLIEWRCVLL